MTRILQILQSAFRLQPNEAKRALAAFCYIFFAIGAFITGRISRSTLFLELDNYRELLPIMYIVQAFAVSGAMLLYARVERRLRRDLTNTITLAIIIVGTIVLHRVMLSKSFAAYASYYLWIEVIGTFLIVQFWSFTNEIFHSRQAKRVFAFVGGGGVLAGVVSGFGIRATSSFLATENLLIVMVASLVVALGLVNWLGREARDELTAALQKAPTYRNSMGIKRNDVKLKVFATRHVKLIAVVVVLTYVVSTLIDYQFNVIVGEEIASKNDRSAYFGVFFGATGLLAAVVQFLITSRVIEKFGVHWGLLALPASMFAGSISVLLVPFNMVAPLFAAAFTKGSENTLRYSMNDTALQLLYLPVPSHIRGRAKAFIDGILKPLAIGGAGLLLAMMKGTFNEILGIDTRMDISVYQVSYLVIAGLLVWLFSLGFLRKEYLASLIRTLQGRRLNFADARFQINDEATLNTLSNALESDQVGEILHALELLPFVSEKARANLSDHLIKMLDHKDEQVQVRVLRYIETITMPDSDAKVEQLLNAKSTKVRSSAVMAFCARHHERGLEQVLVHLDDPDRIVRAATIASMVKYAGLDGVLACADRLKALLGAEDAQDRERAAWILGKVGLQNFYQPLLPLLQDPDDAVRKSAIYAAGQLRTLPLVESLIPQLDHAAVRSVSSRSLASFGTIAHPGLFAALADVEQPAKRRSHICKILARTATSYTAEQLLPYIQDESPYIRSASISSLFSIVSSRPGLRLDRKKIQSALVHECSLTYQRLTLEYDLNLDETRGELLRDALKHTQKRGQERIFGLLGLLYPSQQIDLVERNLRSPVPSTRGNALEVLDNLLDREDKAFVLPLFDDQAKNSRIDVAQERFQIRRQDRTTHLKNLLESQDHWLQSCAALVVLDYDIGSLKVEIEALVRSESAICRETALLVLKRMNKKKSLDRALKKLKNDPDQSVRRYAKHLQESA